MFAASPLSHAEPGKTAKENAGDTAPVDKSYFPELAAGDRREFSFTMTMGNDMEKGKMTIRVEEGKEIRGQRYLKQVAEVEGISGISAADADVAYFRYADDGFYAIEEGEAGFPEHREMPRPVRVGQEWSYRSASGNSSCRAEGYENVKVGDQMIKDCLKVSDVTLSENANKTVTTTWYQRGVGEVKIKIEDGNSVIEACRLKPTPK